MSAIPVSNGGLVRRDLSLTDYRAHAVETSDDRRTTAEATRVLGRWLADVVRDNPETFRLFGPDETVSNRLDPVFDVTDRVWASPSRALGSMDLHYSMAGGWWPSEGIRYRTPGAWVSSMKPVRFEDLVDAVSRDLLHRPASKRLVQTATLATGCKARAKIDRNAADTIS